MRNVNCNIRDKYNFFIDNYTNVVTDLYKNYNSYFENCFMVCFNVKIYLFNTSYIRRLKYET